MHGVILLKKIVKHKNAYKLNSQFIGIFLFLSGIKGTTFHFTCFRNFTACTFPPLKPYDHQ